MPITAPSPTRTTVPARPTAPTPRATALTTQATARTVTPPAVPATPTLGVATAEAATPAAEGILAAAGIPAGAATPAEVGTAAAGEATSRTGSRPLPVSRLEHEPLALAYIHARDDLHDPQVVRAEVGRTYLDLPRRQDRLLDGHDAAARLRELRRELDGHARLTPLQHDLHVVVDVQDERIIRDAIEDDSTQHAQRGSARSPLSCPSISVTASFPSSSRSIGASRR